MEVGARRRQLEEGRSSRSYRQWRVSGVAVRRHDAGGSASWAVAKGARQGTRQTKLAASFVSPDPV